MMPEIVEVPIEDFEANIKRINNKKSSEESQIVEVPIEEFEAKIELLEKKHDQSSTSGAKSSSQKSTTMS